jgi:hypothetical protein
MSAKFKRYVLATLGSTVLMGLLALPAEAKPPASNPPPDNPNAGQPLKPSDGAVINGRLDEIQEQVDNLTDTGNQCTACHNATTVISSKHAQWSVSGHGSGEAFLYGGPRKECAGCHSGGAFVEERVKNGTAVPDVEGDPSPSRQDCRTCHQIHVTYTPADWALQTTNPVDLYAVDDPDAVFNKGKGNLCASCHQPREVFETFVQGDRVGDISGHWGPHHGPQSGMMLGVAGSISKGPVSYHYSDGLPDGCVSCHKPNLHTFAPDTSLCTTCHASKADVLKQIQDDVNALGDELVACGLITENSPDGHPADAITEDGVTIPLDQGAALWNWIYIAHEDKSMGAHNPSYTQELLAASTFTCDTPYK